MKFFLLPFFAGGLLPTAGFPAQARNIPGLTIRQAPTLQPHDSAKVIRISCRTTITSNKPLFVVNGNIIDMDTRLTTLNPNDIGKIEVLKGAAATALYGSRGQYGVFLITTKHKPVVKPYPQRPLVGVMAP